MNVLHDGITASPPVRPGFFGDGAHRLFGIHHGPSGNSVRECGIVLCHAAPQEYGATFWAMHKLAGMLAAAGFHVLRFDYSGTGDSAGSSYEVSLQRCADDIPIAMQHLRDVSGLRRVALVGLRLGAALALRAVAAGARSRDVVLWNPVISGNAYVAQLDAGEAHRLSLLNYPEPDVRLDDELLGYPFSAALRAETRNVNLLAEPLGRINRMLIVGTGTTPAQQALAARAQAAGIDVVVRALSDPELYVGDRHPGDSLLAHEVPLAIVAFLAAGMP